MPFQNEPVAHVGGGAVPVVIVSVPVIWLAGTGWPFTTKTGSALAVKVSRQSREAIPARAHSHSVADQQELAEHQRLTGGDGRGAPG